MILTIIASLIGLFLPGYKGKIARANADGTFDVAYDDGDSERRVSKRNVRALGGAKKKKVKKKKKASLSLENFLLKNMVAEFSLIFNRF